MEAANDFASSEQLMGLRHSASKVGFITEVETESLRPASTTEGKLSVTTSTQGTNKAIVDSASVLPLVSVYCVEDVDPPVDGFSDLTMAAPLPQNLPMDSVMKNIVRNLEFKEHARSMWFKDFKSPPSHAVISDTFWYCICWYFKQGQHKAFEKVLYDRIARNFVALFSAVPAPRKDFFFKNYADAVAQAVLYSMFLAYPKSRVRFTEKFRKQLIKRVSFWTTGVCPEFVDSAHWKLDLGGGDVLQSTDGTSRKPSAMQPTLGPDTLAGRRASLAHRAPRPKMTLRYSPLVDHFLRARKFSSVNLVRATRMSMTLAEERARLMDVKHAILLQRATAARETCDEQVAAYNEESKKMMRQDLITQRAAQTAKKRLEIRRKEVLRSDPHEYANYLVSLHLLQQGHGQSS